ncbi:MAG: hypothetical protein HY898_09975 [Deltaproteobacteria bacterium]|nr:hypothetical protein [Deltaproteobacteria bacterium]
MEQAKLLLAFLDDCCRRLDRKQRPMHFRREWWKTGAAASIAMGVALTLGACGGEGGTPSDQTGDGTADDGATETEDTAAKADAISHPQGTYENKGDKGDLLFLMINSDKTFEAKVRDKDALLSGTYKFTHGGSTNYLRFLLDDGVTVIRYAYTLTSTTLKLRKVGTTTTFSLYALKEICGDGIDNDYDGAKDCGDSDCTSKCGVKYGIPYESICDDDLDNDGDGKVDCADPDCVTSPSCGGTKYGIPYEGDCGDNVDNDGDGKIDCADTDCTSNVTCQGTKYGIPYESVCDDNTDNDSDGKIDCADPDCAGSPNCGGIKYGIPYETDCSDGKDNDGDGQTDCSDGDCAGQPGCFGTKYGIPYEIDCSDGLDNDNDAKIDCDDTDCSSAPNCMGAKYAAPQN